MFLINPYIYGGGAGFTGLLDTYTGATVAYSVRWLNSAYSGALVRIRRSSDNAEKDFYPDTNNELSLSSEDGAGTSLSTWISTDSGYIAKWYDQSGNANDATRPDAAAQPRIVNAGSLDVDPNNGNVALYLNGSSNFLSLTSSVASTQEYYQHFVFNRASSGVYSIGMGISSGANPTPFLWFVDNKTYSAFSATTAHDASQTQTGDFIQTSLRDSSDNVKFWENGTSKTTKTNSGATNSCNQIFRYGGGGYMAGHVQELIYWNSDQESNQSGIEADANAYFSVF